MIGRLLAKIISGGGEPVLANFLIVMAPEADPKMAEALRAVIVSELQAMTEDDRDLLSDRVHTIHIVVGEHAVEDIPHYEERTKTHFFPLVGYRSVEQVNHDYRATINIIFRSQVALAKSARQWN